LFESLEDNPTELNGVENSVYTVPLQTVTGTGSGAIATVTTASNAVSAITVVTPGIGYAPGDQLAIPVNAFE